MSFIPHSTSASDTGYFIVTAYYSPLPDQDYYITWNYESEKRLNGQWIAGASGKKVFSGMLAAPWKYAFGTKIELEWLWIGSVDDRGGAIVPAGERGYSHDRIDIWVGSWDEWLRRAMYWGKRKIAWKIVWSENAVSLDFNDIPAPKWAVPNTTTLYGNTVQVAQENNSPVLDIFSTSLWKWSDSETIKKLQEILTEIGYYTFQELTWVYDSHTIDAVYNFQINNEIVQDEFEKWAGSYGPKTRQKLKDMYLNFSQEKQQEEQFLDLVSSYEAESNVSSQEYIDSLGKPKYWDISPEVRAVQKLLTQLWYFDYKDTAIFWVKTRNSIIDFQLEHNLIGDNTDQWAGVFWPKTRETIIQELSKIHLHEQLEQEWLLEKYNETVLQNIETENTQQEEISQDSISSPIRLI